MYGIPGGTAYRIPNNFYSLRSKCLENKIDFLALEKTLGVPCAEIYPLNLMQLVLPKGKVK
jgi:hypothetical protein